MAVTQGQTYVVPVAMYDNTGLTAALAAATIYAVPAGKTGMYRVHIWMRVTTAGATTSTLPNADLVFTSGGITITTGTTNGAGGGQAAQGTGVGPHLIGTNQGNATGTCSMRCVDVYADASTNIQIVTANFAANASMTYELRCRVEFLG